MKDETQCLQASDLEALLAGNIPASQSDFWEEHLSSCDNCRHTMADRVGDQDWWHEAEQSLMSEQIAEERETSGPADPDHENAAHESTDELLRLLGPTDDPQMLGRIGTYEVLGVLGRGGMGIVFKAFDAPLNRYVAIKMLLPHLAASGAARKRFEREGQAAAAVIDDHVLPIYAVSQWQNVPYLVMQYSSGKNLQRRIDDEGPLAVKEILRIGMQAARGLAAAHAQGLVHRDVKPSNMLLDGSVERVMLSDFGLARAVDDASITRTGMIAGTPQYMSPEQARGKSVDARSDLFGLGCVLYSLCTGHPPFRAENSLAILRLITDEEPRAIQEVNADIPDWLCAIIRKLMSKEAEERFDSADDVAELLEDCLAHVQQPTTTPLPSGVAKLVKSCGIEHGGGLSDSFDDAGHTPIGKWIAAAAFAFSLIFAGVFLVLELNKGTLTIECDADDVPIRIMQNEELVERLTVSRSGASTRIAAGNYTIELEGDFETLAIENNVVTISRGGTEAIKVTQADDAIVKSYDVSDLIEKDSGVPVEDAMSSLIELATTIEPDSWESKRFLITPDPQNKTLLVRQADTTHNKLRLLFERLRLRQVEVKSELLDLIKTAESEITFQIDNMNTKLAALPEASESSPESQRLRIRLKRSEELLAELSKQAKTIQDLRSGEAQKKPKTKQENATISPGDTVAVYIPGVLPRQPKGQPAISPPVTQLPSGKTVTGYPLRVCIDGTVRLPFLAPIPIKDMSARQAEQAILSAYLDTQILRKGTADVFLTKVAGDRPLQETRIQPGAMVAIYLPGILPSDANAPPPVNRHRSGEVVTGFPLEVSSDGTLRLPHIKPMNVAGQTVREAEETIFKAYIKNQILREDAGHPLLALVSKDALDAEHDKKEQTATESRHAFHKRIPESGTVLVMFDDGSKISQQMSPVAQRVAKSTSIELIEQPLAGSPWIKKASSHVSPGQRSGLGGPQFVLIKDRQQVGIRYGLLTEKRLREFVRTADNWLTPHAAGVDETSMVRIDCYINPGKGSEGKQVGGAFALTTVVVAVHEDQALLLGSDSIAGYLDGRYACVAMVRDESGDSKQLPLDVVQIGPVKLLGQDESEKEPDATLSVTLGDGTTREVPMVKNGDTLSVAEFSSSQDTGLAIYHIRGAFGLTSVRLADLQFLPEVDQSVLSGGYLRDRRSRPAVDFGSPLLWQSQIVKSNDDATYGPDDPGPGLTDVICPTVPAPVGFTFSTDGLLIGSYALGTPTEKDMTHYVFHPVTTHSVLRAAVDKVEDGQLKAKLLETLKPR